MIRPLGVLAVAFFFVGFPALADPDVAAVQSTLKDLGFYYGEADGSWGDETSAAVTRYQIRHGLEINGRLNAETLRSLGMEEDGAAKTELPRGDAWKILRDADAAALEDRSDQPPTDEPPVTHGESPPPKVAAGVPSPPPEASPPPRDPFLVAEPVSESTPVSQQPRAVLTRERLRDYIAAYVLAGLAPTVEAELEFFADRVDYFGTGSVDKAFIRRDLMRYNAQYPIRRFWLAGDPGIQSETDEIIRVNFPLRFEVSGESGSKGGKVLKTVELRKTGRSLEITSVDERRLD